MRINKLTNFLTYRFSTKKFCQILGISINASTEEIKSAYYQKAKAHHPDLNPHESGMKFNQIRNAYEQLMKKGSANAKGYQEQAKPKSGDYAGESERYRQHESRKSRNRKRNSFRQEDFQRFYEENEDFEQQDQQWQFEQVQFKQFQKAFNSYLRNGYLKSKYMKFKPYFDQIFSYGTQNFSHSDFEFQQKKRSSSYQRHQNRQQEKYRMEEQFEDEYQKQDNIKNKHRMKKLDIAYNLQLKPEQVGKTLKIKFQREINCYQCQFHFQQNYTKIICKSCQKGDHGSSKSCPNCKGKGFTRKYQCKLCRNKGFLRKLVEEVVMIPLGLEDGQKLVLQGRGHQHRRKGTFGDLVINITFVGAQQTGGKKTKQAGSSEIQVTILEAVLGCMATVKTGKGLTQIKIPAGTQHGDVIKNVSPKNIINKFKINLIIPSKISEQEKAIFERLREVVQRNSNAV